MDRESNDRIIGYIIQVDESLGEKGGVRVRGRKGFPQARAAHVPYGRVTPGLPQGRRTLHLYNYLLRFYLIMPPPLKRIVPNPLYTQASIKPYKNLNKGKNQRGKSVLILRIERQVVYMRGAKILRNFNRRSKLSNQSDLPY